MGIGQLLAGLTTPQASPILAVGQAAISTSPGGLRDWAISAFGRDDKTVLLGGIVVVVFCYALAVGMLAVRRIELGMAGLGVFAALGLAAALTRPNATAGYAVPTLAGAAFGAVAMWLLVRAAYAAVPQAAEPRIVFGDAKAPRPEPARRDFIATAGGVSAVAVVSGFAGQGLSTKHNVSAARASVRLPAATTPAPPLPAGSDLRIPGLSSFITPNAQFYRVDTALFVPQVDPRNWTLRIHGMVRREVELTFGQLLRRPLLEDYITLCCVSNPVAGPYISNARWLGTSLADLLRMAGPLAGASQLLCTSTDGFTSGTPLAVVLDGRDSMVAVGMNGLPLPVEHGFPARLVVPGLYGYVSACKWVTDIEVTTFAAASAYWVQEGWSQQAPIKTESRIDVPLSGATVKAGRVAVAGVAWAQHKGIEAVEVRVDRGPWQAATLAAVPDLDCWRQWVWQWDATAGSHVIEARATDKTGYTQTALAVPPTPNGATGYPAASVNVTG